MENPLCWNEIEKTIDAAIRVHQEDMDEGVIGASDVRYIYDALLAKGYINDPDKKPST